MSGERVGFRFKHADAVVKEILKADQEEDGLLNQWSKPQAEVQKCLHIKYVGGIVKDLKLSYNIC